MSGTKRLIFGCDSSPISPLVCLLVGNKGTNLDKMRESNLTKGCKPSENHTKRSYSMDFGFVIIIDFAMMNTDKLNRLMDVIVEFALLTFRKSYQKVKQHRFWL